MAEVAGLAASVITIIELSAKVSALCLDYSTAVSNARADIARLRSRVDNLAATFRAVQKLLLDDTDGQVLQTARELVDPLRGCRTVLDQLQSRLDSSKTQRVMHRFGLRALRWPFNSGEIDDILSRLERHEQTITLGLQVDQTTLLLDIRQRLKRISIQPDDDASTTRNTFFMVPFERDPDFVNRPDIMMWMMEQYTGPASRMALVGMGGFGKSQIAIQFAHYIREASPQTSIFWVHASSETRFEEAYRCIADRLQLPWRNDPNVNVLGLVRDWLQREEVGPWLMVLDNADDVNLFYGTPRAGNDCVLADGNPTLLRGKSSLASFLPKRRDGTIFVTSRSLDVAEKLTGSHRAVCRISAMDDIQSLELFRNKVEGEFDEDSAAALLRALDHIPLAITQAAAYINRRAPRISVRTYLDDFCKSDRKKGSLLNSDAGDLRRDETVANSVIATWQVTFEQIRREKQSAADLLSFMSFFNPQGIPEFVLHSYRDDTSGHANAHEDKFEDDLDVLRGYSLVSTTAKGGVCEMHSLVQFCTRVWLSQVNNTEQWKRVFLLAMAKHFPSGVYETWPICQMLLPHVESILDEGPPEENQQQWTHLLTKCAWYLLVTGNYIAAEDLNEKATERRAIIFGEEHSDTLTSMSNLALTYTHQGRLKEAEELGVRVMKTRKAVLREEHPDTLTSISNLALIYWHQGRWKEAEELGVRVTELRTVILGEEHPDTLISIGILASTYSKQARWKEAKELEMQLLETRKAVLGEEHPDTLISMNNLVSAYTAQGKWKEAEELGVQAMEISSAVLGEKHPNTLTSIATLASIYSNQGRWKEAEELEVQVMEISLAVLGEKHPNTLSSMVNLAWTYRKQGQYQKAEELGVQAVKTSSAVLGEEHPNTLSSIGDLASTYWEQDRCKEAEELGVQAVKTSSAVLGEEHPHTLTSIADLAIIYWKQGRWKEAEELGMQVIETRKTVLGEEHPHTLTSMNNLAFVWNDQGRSQDALALMQHCFVARDRVLGSDHPDTVSSSITLAGWQE
ncbi:unnamed protein product [Clonostachys rhizophaga]|uniref:DUF7779 domain-containing protein n=1 Tax=Clonostachys rhizophaga TaxID=160324 RepID=A0A9N9VT42_9HYPO|nr:unnamed protein product [Clonostachys rhizophaga]